MRELRRIVVHHSASSRSTRTAAIRRWHKSKGWRDIGYHYIIEDDGSLHYGRPLGDIGAHARGANHDSIGICIVGDNTRADGHWLPIQWRTLGELVDALHLAVGPLPVFGHREVGTTATVCPGIDPDEIRRRLSQR